jgi:prolipoprotein diacylglyceryltransferase
MLVHTLFDLLAAFSSVGMTVLVYKWRLAGAAARIESAGAGYVIALVTGAALGGFGLGSLNLALSGEPGLARSIVGALAGAIAAVELFKWVRGIAGSTGIIFVPAFATTVAIGRWGCFFAGLPDNTHGIPTSMPWAHDFGDGVLRHPVQVYESFAMLIFLVFALIALARQSEWFLRKGFYVMVLCYASQRFLWEFLKPYGTVVGPLNLFHLVSMGLVAYAVVMLGRDGNRRP